MSEKGNAGSFIITVSDDTAQGLEKVLTNLAKANQRVKKQNDDAAADAKKAAAIEAQLAKQAAADEKALKAVSEATAKQRRQDNELYAAQLRAQGAEIRRVGEVSVQSSSQRQSAQMAILRLEEKALQVERAQAETALERLRIDEAIKDNVSNQKALTGEMQKQGGAAGQLGAGLQKIGPYAVAATAAIYALTSAVRMADEAMQKGFSQRQIMANVPFAIDKARAATMGFVDDVKLSQLAIEAQRLGVVKNADSFALLTQAATKLGMSVGQDATSSVESLVGALGRGETELLDNLGVTLKVGDAHKEYAKQLGVSVNALTDEQKAEAFRVVGLQRALEASDKLNISMTESETAWIAARAQYDKLARETLPEATDRMTTTWEAAEAGGRIAEDMIPVLTAFADGIAYLLTPVVWGFEAIGSGLGWLAGKWNDYAVESKRAQEDTSKWFADTSQKISDSRLVKWLDESSTSMGQWADEGLTSMRSSIEEMIPATMQLTSAWDRT